MTHMIYTLFLCLKAFSGLIQSNPAGGWGQTGHNAACVAKSGSGRIIVGSGATRSGLNNKDAPIAVPVRETEGKTSRLVVAANIDKNQGFAENGPSTNVGPFAPIIARHLAARWPR